MTNSTALPLLILLPGALGAIEGLESLADTLRGERQVIAIAYRSDDGLESLLDRIEIAAETAGCSRFDLLGQSYGAWIAQCFVRRNPQRVRRLILSHGFRLQPEHAWRFGLAGAAMRLLPQKLMTRLVLKRSRLALSPLQQLRPEEYRRRVERVASAAGSTELFDVLWAQQRVLRQSCEINQSRSPVTDNAMPILIIESDNDPIVDENERAELRHSYPQAEVCRFDGTGHITALIDPSGYREAILRFLA